MNGDRESVTVVTRFVVSNFGGVGLAREERKGRQAWPREQTSGTTLNQMGQIGSRYPRLPSGMISAGSLQVRGSVTHQNAERNE